MNQDWIRYFFVCRSHGKELLRNMPGRLHRNYDGKRDVQVWDYNKSREETGETI